MITGLTDWSKLEFEGVEGIDNKDTILPKLQQRNIGSTYLELKKDRSGISAVFKLNIDEKGSLAWYKI